MGFLNFFAAKNRGNSKRRGSDVGYGEGLSAASMIRTPSFDRTRAYASQNISASPDTPGRAHCTSANQAGSLPNA